MADTSVSLTSEPGKPAAPAPLTPADTSGRKPYTDFPLFAHATGRWAKKIKGKLHYFGKLADGWPAALAQYDKHKARLHAGLPRLPDETDAVTIAQLCDSFYEFKRRANVAGEITARSLADYDITCKLITTHLNRAALVTELTPDDFGKLREKLAESRGPVALSNEINRIRMVMKFHNRNNPKAPAVHMGDQFSRPKAKVIRIHKAKAKADRGDRTLEADQIRRLIDAADFQMKAMILLGINCGMGNNDMAELRTSDFNLDTAIIDYARPKTGIERRAHLWPETIAALKVAIAERYTPSDPAHDNLVFVTKYRNPWATGTSDNPISKSFAILLNDLGMKRKGLNFYALRHSFASRATEVGDDKAKCIVMGHVQADVEDGYVDRFPLARLKAVTDHVRAWLFSKPAAAKPTTKAASPKKRKPRAPKPSGERTTTTATVAGHVLRLVG